MTILYGRMIPLLDEPEWRVDYINRATGELVFDGVSASSWIVPGTLNFD